MKKKVLHLHDGDNVEMKKMGLTAIGGELYHSWWCPRCPAVVYVSTEELNEL